MKHKIDARWIYSKGEKKKKLKWTNRISNRTKKLCNGERQRRIKKQQQKKTTTTKWKIKFGKSCQMVKYTWPFSCAMRWPMCVCAGFFNRFYLRTCASHNLLMIMKCLSNLKFWCLINWRFIYVRRCMPLCFVICFVLLLHFTLYASLSLSIWHQQNRFSMVFFYSLVG